MDSYPTDTIANPKRSTSIDDPLHQDLYRDRDDSFFEELFACSRFDRGVRWLQSFYGKVVLEDGNPIQFGTVEFRLRDLLKQYKERIVARGKIEQDGSFRLSTFEPNDGAVPGDYEVIVNQLIISRDLSFEAHGHGPRVSPRYVDYALSGLSAKIEAIKDPQDKSTNQVVLKLLRDDGSASRSP